MEERLRYLAYRAAQGSTRNSLRIVAQHMLVFVDVLRLETDDKVTIEQIRTAADLSVGSQPYAHNITVTDGRHGRLRFISEAKQWLKFLGHLHLPEVPPRPYANLVDEFADDMIRQRGLSRNTVRIHCWNLGQFFDRFSQQHRSLSEISVRDIDAAIARRCERASYARASIKNYATTLRAFFRYAEQRGWCTRGLAAGIMAPRLTQAYLTMTPELLHEASVRFERYAFQEVCHE